MASQSNPWLGLASYTESNKLYGRDAEIQSLLDIVTSNKEITVIYGKSGIGKTSLLRAGLFPRVRSMGFFPVYVRLDHSATATLGYTAQVIKAVGDEALACRLSVTDRLDGSAPPPATLWEFFHRFSYTTMAGDECLPVVFFDQFEEIFTISADNRSRVDEFLRDLSGLLNDVIPEEARNQGPAKVESRRAAEEISIDLDDNDALADGYSPVMLCRLAISLREDQLYHLERISDTTPALKRNRYFLHGLTSKGALEVITMPRPGLVAPDVAREILDKCRNTGDEYVDPAFLSLVMYKLYERMDSSSQRVISSSLVASSVDNIFADYYRDSIKGIPSHVVDFLEDKLVSKTGFRLSVPVDDAFAAGLTEQQLNRLKDSRIMTVLTRGNHSFIELTHDLLCAEVIRDKVEREKAKLARKNRRRVITLSAITLVILAIAAVFAYQYSQILEGQDRLRDANARLESEKLYSDSLLHNSKIANALLQKQYDDLDIAQRLLDSTNLNLNQSNKNLFAANRNIDLLRNRATSDKAVELLNSGDSYTATVVALECISKYGRDANTDYILRSAHLNDNGIVDLGIWEVDAIAYSPDGKRFAAATNDYKIHVLDPATGAEIMLPLEGHDSWINFLDFAGNDRIISAGADRKIILWDLNTGKKIKSINVGGRVLEASLGPDNKIAALTTTGKLIIYDISNGNILDKVDTNKSIYNRDQICFSPDGKNVFALINGDFYKYALGSHDLPTILISTKGLSCFALDPTGKIVVFGNEDGSISKLDIMTGKFTGRSEKLSTEEISSVSFSKDGKQIFATIGNSGEIIVLDAEEKKSNRIIRTGTPIYFAAISPDSQHFVTGGADKKLRLKKFDHTSLIEKNMGNSFNGLWHLDETGNAVWQVEDRYFVLRDLYTDKEIKRVKSGLKSSDEPHLNGVSHTGRYLGFQISSKTYILDTHKNVLLSTSSSYRSPVAFSPSDKIVAIVDEKSGEKVIKICDIESGDNINTINHTADDRRIDGILFTPDEKNIVVIGSLGSVMTYDLTTGNGTHVSGIKNGKRHSAIAYSPDGRLLATSDYVKGDITITDVASRKTVFTSLTGNTGVVRGLCFSEDGRYLMSSSDWRLRIWDMTTGKECQVPIYGSQNDVRFNKEGDKIIVYTYYDNGDIITVFDFPTVEELEKKARERFKNRKLTPEERRKFYID